MTPPVPPLPRWVALLALALGLGLTVAAAALEGITTLHGWPALAVRGLHGLVQTLGGAAFALAGLNEALRGWQRLRWRRITQWLAFDLLDQAIREVKAIAVSAAGVLAEHPGGDERIEALNRVFALPWSQARALALKDARAALNDHAEALFAGARPGQVPEAGGARLRAGVAGRAVAAGPGLEHGAERLRAVVSELGPFIDEEAAIQLLTAVTRLHEPVRGLARPPLGALRALLAGTLVLQLLEASGTVAAQLDAAYRELRAHTSNQELEAKLAMVERRAAEESENLRGSPASRLETDAVLRDTRRPTAEDVVGRLLDELDAED